MSLYGQQNAVLDETYGVNMEELVENFYYDDIHRMSSDQIHEFCEGEQAKALLERSVLKKPTLMRLSKEDDEKRRIKLACYQLAKDAKDPNWDKMLKYRALWKKYRALVFKKYGNKAARLAKVSQKEYIKKAAKEKATPEQQRVQNAR
jgi:hypothetical protein